MTLPLTSVRSLEDDVPDDWEVGDVILDRYQVTTLLGEGGMGKVYQVRHLEWNLDLAVKSPRPHMLATGGVESFIKEAQTWVHLGLHQHIVVCYYVRVLGGIPRLFTELVPGGDLAEWIHHGKLYHGGPRVALQRILDIAIQTAWGLDHAHHAGLVHQDMKPANVMLMPDGTAKVSDFGLAEYARITMSKGATFATPAYASPEQMTEQPLGQPTDIWSWGLTVLEMFMRKWPSYGPHAVDVITEYLEEETDDGVHPRLPPALFDLLISCFSDDPAARPTIDSLAEALLDLYAITFEEDYPRPRPGEIDMRADHLNNRAVSLMDLGQAEEARQYLDDAVMADPWHLFASYNREVLRWRRGRITDEELLDRMRELHTARSDRWVVRYLTGCIQLERGDEDLAIDDLLAAEREVHDNPIAVALVDRARQQVVAGFRCGQPLVGAAGSLHAVVLSNDGELAAAAGEEGVVFFWDLVKQRPLRQMRLHSGPIHGLALSPDSQILATAGRDGKAKLLEFAEGRVLATLSSKAPVRSVAVAAQGRLVVTGSEDGMLRFWDKRGKLLRGQQAHDGPITGLALSAGARHLAAVSEDRRLTWWDVETGTLVSTIEQNSPVHAVALTSDAQHAVTAAEDGILRFCELATGVVVRSLSGHRAPVRSVSLSSNGQWAVSASEDASLRKWELDTGRCAATMRSTAGWLHSVAVHRDNHFAVTASSDMTLRIWRLAWDTPRTPPMVVRPRTSAELLENRQQYLGCLARVDHSWDQGHLDLALEALAAARAVPGYERSAACLGLWATMLRCATRVKVQRAWLLKSMAGHHDTISSVAFDSTAHYIVSASEDSTLRVWQTATGECMMTLAGQQAPVHRMALRADAERAVSIGDGEDVAVWDIPGERIERRWTDHLRRVKGLAMTPDGRVVVSAGQEGRLRVWDPDRGECLATMPGLGEHLAITPDGRIVALATSGGRVRIYDMRTQKCVQILRGHQGPVNGVALSPDGRLAVSAGEDGTVQVFDLSRGGKRVVVLEGHQRGVLCVDVTCDGRHVISGGRDRTLRVWSVANPTDVPLRLLGHTGAVTDVKLNADGSMAVSGCSDGWLRVWHLDWELATHPVAMWDATADPCLEAFLCRKAAAESKRVRPLAERIWQDEDFAELDYDLACWGFGWLHPDGVRQRLLQVAPAWAGPADLPRTNTQEDDTD